MAEYQIEVTELEAMLSLARQEPVLLLTPDGKEFWASITAAATWYR